MFIGPKNSVFFGPGPVRFEGSEFGTGPSLSGFSVPQSQELRQHFPD